MESAERLKKIPPYLFMELRQKIGKAKAAGVDVISLAIGDPVEPTPEAVIHELARAAHDPANHQYPTDEEKGMLSFREAVARWYAKRYGVTVDPQKEVLALIGSKEGCHHFALARVNPGDVVLMTDPGYPAYRASILIAGGEPVNVPIRPEQGYRPVLRDIPSDVARRASAMFLNYPNNPTGGVATTAFLKELVEFARSYDIAISYDNPYTEIVFDGETPLSFVGTGREGRRRRANSLSKPFNMTGWRIGMGARQPRSDRGDLESEGEHRLGRLQRHSVRRHRRLHALRGRHHAHVADLCAAPRSGRRHAAPGRYRIHAGKGDVLPLGADAERHVEPRLRRPAARESARRRRPRPRLRRFR
jgi:LL-diaminopimelate aminotransferase